ncbi:MAG: phosphatase PAP2 family protein [Myxococcales bacterium]|nr:phosphatase PAP2 family protein [Myxococcales bacterium]
MTLAKSLLRVLGSLLLLLLTQRSALAQEEAPEASKNVFEFDLAVELPLLAGGLALFLTPQLLQKEIQADHCAPCDPDNVNWLDRKVIGWRSKTTDVASDVLAIAVPVGAIIGSTVSNRSSQWHIAEDTFLILESVVLSGVINQITRHAFTRPRPYMYLNPVPDYRHNDAEDWHSFFSGHTSSVYAGATAFARIQTLRNPDSKWNPLVWMSSLGLASMMPVFRLKAGEHFFTDVATGALVGMAAGFLVPSLHRKNPEDTVPALVISRNFYGLKLHW